MTSAPTNDANATPAGRTVTHQYTQEQLEQLYSRCTGEEVVRAIAYLSTWALDSDRYRHCALIVSDSSADQPEIIATYRDDDGLVRYVIGAIWHDTHFGFHS